MLKIIIVGDRSEGKSTLGMIIRYLLNKHTNYTIDYDESGEGGWSKKRWDKQYEEAQGTSDWNYLTPEGLKSKIAPKKVNITVVNTSY